MGEFKTYFTHLKIEILALASGRAPILFTATKFFLLIRNTQETRGPKVSKRVCPYLWVYIVYMFFDDFFLMHSLRKSPSDRNMYNIIM